MSRQQVIEGNKLIAEFMGWAYPHIESFKRDIVFHESHNYDTRWDKLMPVVEKIGFYNFDIKIHLYVESKNGHKYNVRRCIIEDSYKGEISFDERDELPITAIWKSIVQFITWYNTQNK